MLTRCYKSDVYGYRWYGANGIEVCDRWRFDFLAFLSDIGRKPKPHFVLGRIDKQGDYEPDNCMWIDRRYARWTRETSRKSKQRR